MDVNFTSDGGTKKYKYSLDCEATVTARSNRTWLTASIDQAKKEITITVTINSDDTRYGTVEFYVAGKPNPCGDKLSITQQGSGGGGGGCDDFNPTIEYSTNPCDAFHPTVKYDED